MLFVSVIVSVVVLLVANWIVFRARHSGSIITCGSLALILAQFLLFCILPPVAFQAILLSVATTGWRISGRGPGVFIPISCAATLAAFGCAGLIVMGTEREYARLRVLYPLESMAARVPAPKPSPRNEPVTNATAKNLAYVESEIDQRRDGYRNVHLMILHDRAVSLFENSPGFGVMRMSRPSESNLAADHRERVPVPPQPGPRVPPSSSPGLWSDAESEVTDLGRVIDESVVDFSYPEGFGYVKDRRHVAGFLPHRFSQVPTPAVRWRVQTLDLVGLLVHDEPVAYVSDLLPRMDRLHQTPTRPLDDFESTALDVLGRGEELFVVRDGDHLRMMGAVRSAMQCVDCHGGRRGDLLGAFSYVLRPTSGQ